VAQEEEQTGSSAAGQPSVDLRHAKGIQFGPGLKFQINLNFFTPAPSVAHSVESGDKGSRRLPVLFAGLRKRRRGTIAGTLLVTAAAGMGFYLLFAGQGQSAAPKRPAPAPDGSQARSTPGSSATGITCTSTAMNYLRSPASVLTRSGSLDPQVWVDQRFASAKLAFRAGEPYYFMESGPLLYEATMWLRWSADHKNWSNCIVHIPDKHSSADPEVFSMAVPAVSNGKAFTFQACIQNFSILRDVKCTNDFHYDPSRGRTMPGSG
jgi:hypothetical protein